MSLLRTCARETGAVKIVLYALDHPLNRLRTLVHRAHNFIHRGGACTLVHRRFSLRCASTQYNRHLLYCKSLDILICLAVMLTARDQGHGPPAHDNASFARTRHQVLQACRWRRRAALGWSGRQKTLHIRRTERPHKTSYHHRRDGWAHKQVGCPCPRRTHRRRLICSII